MCAWRQVEECRVACVSQGSVEVYEPLVSDTRASGSLIVWESAELKHNTTRTRKHFAHKGSTNATWYLISWKRVFPLCIVARFSTYSAGYEQRCNVQLSERGVPQVAWCQGGLRTFQRLCCCLLCQNRSLFPNIYMIGYMWVISGLWLHPKSINPFLTLPGYYVD